MVNEIHIVRGFLRPARAGDRLVSDRVYQLAFRCGLFHSMSRETEKRSLRYRALHDSHGMQINVLRSAAHRFWWIQLGRYGGGSEIFTSFPVRVPIWAPSVCINETNRIAVTKTGTGIAARLSVCTRE